MLLVATICCITRQSDQHKQAQVQVLWQLVWQLTSRQKALSWRDRPALLLEENINLVLHLLNWVEGVDDVLRLVEQALRMREGCRPTNGTLTLRLSHSDMQYLKSL